MPNYKKRSKYQTGGSAKPMPPRTMQNMPSATGQRMASGTQTAASQEAQRKRQEMIKRQRAMMEVGNRQRAAAMEAARKRAYNQATARQQRPVRGPSRSQAARNLAEYNAAMRARQAMRSRVNDPSPRPVPQPIPRPTPVPVREPSPRPDTPPNFRPYLGRTVTRPVPTFDMKQGRMLTPQELQRLRTNPNRPNMVNQVRNLSQAKAAERKRIQQQIAQLQARLRQLGG